VRERLDVIDLGCGTGELTEKLARFLPDSHVLGIDTSAEMLAKAREGAEIDLNVEYKLQAIEDLQGKYDLIFSNAAIHWVEDHKSLFPMLWEHLKPGGQIVVQVPSGVRNKAQRVVIETAESECYLEKLGGWRWNFPVLPVHEYAEALYRLGATDITAFEKIYPHVLKDGEAVFDWVAGTTMNAYLKRLPEKYQEQFRMAVKAEVVKRYPGSPVFFPFRRIFFSGMSGGSGNGDFVATP